MMAGIITCLAKDANKPTNVTANLLKQKCLYNKVWILNQKKEITMDKNLSTARELLKNIHTNDDFDQVLITEHPEFTVMVSPNDFGEAEPLVEIISNKDLLKIYDYAIRCFEGDPVFDDFDGPLMNLGLDDLINIFVDLFNGLVKINRNTICRIMDYEAFMKRKKPKLTVVS